MMLGPSMRHWQYSAAQHTIFKLNKEIWNSFFLFIHYIMFYPNKVFSETLIYIYFSHRTKTCMRTCKHCVLTFGWQLGSRTTYLWRRWLKTVDGWIDQPYLVCFNHCSNSLYLTIPNYAHGSCQFICQALNALAEDHRKTCFTYITLDVSKLCTYLD